MDDEALEQIINHLNCTQEIELRKNFTFDVISTVETPNGSLCVSSNSKEADRPTNASLKCEIVGHPDFKPCHHSEGSFKTTFASYLATRVAHTWSTSIAWGVFDGAILRLANQHNSDYSNVVIFTQVVVTFGTLVPGLVIQDADKTSGGVINPIFKAIF